MLIIDPRMVATGVNVSIKVAVNGYGTIGKRVADAVSAQKDMTLVGVAKVQPTFEAQLAVKKGYKLFVAGNGKREDFAAAGVHLSGTLEDLLREADVVIDCTPEKVGAVNKELYDKVGIRAIWQGGEKSTIAEHSFSAMANYATCVGAKRLRVVSCNTTGLARAGALLTQHYGVERWETTLIRRAADPGESKKGPINGILPTMKLPSHHGPDVQTVLPGLNITTAAVVVPTTLMHVHFNHVTLQRPPSGVGAVHSLLSGEPRFVLFAGTAGVEGTPQVMEWARDRGGSRSDVMENVLWENGIKLDGRELYFFQAIHQESIVVPENIDAVRAAFSLETDSLRSMALTNSSLGLTAGATRAPRPSG
jgi:glyceraldehyde-3-phosphate dehydrogenase (NAD(P))